jgi:hypothetical protein
MVAAFRSSGATSIATTAITPATPGDAVADDILTLVCRTQTGQAIAIANANGGTWAETPDSPQDNGADVRLTTFWSRHNGTQGDPTTTDSGVINMARILAFSGCPTTGDPWDVTAGNSQAATTAGSIPGDTSTEDDVLVVAIAASDRDANSSTNASAWANASLDSITEWVDQVNNLGIGGGFAIAGGLKSAAGTIDATTWTQAASAGLANIMIALKSAAALPPAFLLGEPARRLRRVRLTI